MKKRGGRGPTAKTPGCGPGDEGSIPSGHPLTDHEFSAGMQAAMRYPKVLVHKGCGGQVEWEDTAAVDEDYVCSRCGAVVDGEDIDVRIVSR